RSRFPLCPYTTLFRSIGRKDPVTGLCVVIYLAAPSGAQLGITAPGQWGVQRALAGYGDAGCPGPPLGQGLVVLASSGTGAIDFEDRKSTRLNSSHQII